MSDFKTFPHLLVIAITLALPSWVITTSLITTSTASASPPEPTPDGMENPESTDRLAEPLLGENPTQYEQGRYDYWMHCMPCHGDYGQGLTQEFIELWPPDHQGCWDRGCHGGRIEDEGFPIPEFIPAVITSGGMANYSSPEDLFAYLQATHPPQNPGGLDEETYWAITNFVLAESGFTSRDEGIGPEVNSELFKLGIQSAAVIVVILVTVIITGQIWKASH
jgi:hypothetical protein